MGVPKLVDVEATLDRAGLKNTHAREYVRHWAELTGADRVEVVSASDDARLIQESLNAGEILPAGEGRYYSSSPSATSSTSTGSRSPPRTSTRSSRSTSNDGAKRSCVANSTSPSSTGCPRRSGTRTAASPLRLTPPHGERTEPKTGVDGGGVGRASHVDVSHVHHVVACRAEEAGQRRGEVVVEEESHVEWRSGSSRSRMASAA
jgi:hypothetical protein